MTLPNTSRYVEIPGTFGGWAAVTVAAWAYAMLKPFGFQAMLSAEEREFLHHQIHTDPTTGDFKIGVYANTPIPTGVVPLPCPTIADGWHHYAAAASPGDGRTYVDGVLLGAPATESWGSNVTSTSELTLARGFEQGRYLSGRLGKVALFDTKLSAAEIAGLAGAATAAAYDAAILAEGPVAYWRLDETTGTVAADSSGNGHHGIYRNQPLLAQPGPLGGGDVAAQFVRSGGFVVGAVSIGAG